MYLYIEEEIKNLQTMLIEGPLIQLRKEASAFEVWCFAHRLRYSDATDSWYCLTNNQDDYPKNFARVTYEEVYNKFLEEYKPTINNMTKTLIESSEELYAKALETMKKKNADYAGSTSSMKNFEVSAQVANIKMSQGILTRLMDKMTRIGNLINKEAAVSDESIFDTLQDAINYTAILKYALEIERNERDSQLALKFGTVEIVMQKPISSTVTDPYSHPPTITSLEENEKI